MNPGRALLAAPLAVALTGGTAGPEDWRAPESERARANPVAPIPAVLQKGRALYQKHCFSCHGEKGKGDGAAAPFNPEKPPDLTEPERQQALTDGEILWKITTGRKVEDDVLMPAMAEKIPAEEDRWKLVAFVRTLRAR